MRSMRRSPAKTERTGISQIVLRFSLALLIACALLAGISGGLVRAGAMPVDLGNLGWMGHAAVDHAALMLSAFLGSVIGVERAVALRHSAAFSGPLASAISGLCLLAGQPVLAGWLGVTAAAIFVCMNLVFLVRQPEPHIALLLIGALSWAGGNILFAIDHGSSRAFTCWFAFLVLTIAAERLEMHRLMRARPLAYPMLFLVVVWLLAGTAVSLLSTALGGLMFGAALIALAAWLLFYDVARRTVLTHGMARYMAVCLLGGYVWLAIAGLAWMGTAVGCPGRDMALHALGLGFVISMVMGHAPVILPAVARVKLQYGKWFYLPLVLLHVSLVTRLFMPMKWPQMRDIGVMFNAIALATFAATLLLSALVARRQAPGAAIA